MINSAARPFVVPRWVGLIVVALLTIVSLASIVVLFTESGTDLVAQGPAAVDPHIETELAVLFDAEIVAVAQRSLHVIGIAVFLGLAILLIVRTDASDQAPLAAITLAALGTSLFAPLTLLPGGDAIAQVVGSITPDTLIWFWGSLAGISLLAFLATFPDGIWNPIWTKWLVIAAAISGLLALVLDSTLLDLNTWPTSLQIIWLVGLPGAAITAQLIRRRRTPLAQATKPVVVSLLVALGAFLLLWLLQPELTEGVLDLVVVTPRLRAVYAVNLLVILTVAIFLFPISVWFAIVRHRLFDLDLLINRTLVYGIVTALVAIAFLMIAVAVTVITQVSFATAIGGSASGPTGVVFGAALVLLFQPLRRRVQRGVDRRFYRERYDARQVIDHFAGQAARLVDQVTLEAELVSVVERALQPTTVELHTGPFSDVTKEALDTATAIDLSHFENPGLEVNAAPGTEVVVPLVAGGSLTGLLELGPRASASRYSTLDLELLDRLAQTAGPALQLAHEVGIREREALRQERANHELELARKIQQGLLPHELPQIEGWSFNAFYSPAREVGGDFYDWLNLPDGRLVVVIGDVSDKGIPAAMVMATCRTLLRISAGGGGAPGEVLAEVNDRIRPDIPPEMFVTCQLVVVDPSTGSLVIANAGHNLPIHKGSEETVEITARGMPLGLMPGMDYEEVAGQIDRGDSLVLTSDGLAEAHSPEGEMFGTSRLRRALEQGQSDLLATALKAHGQFVGLKWEQEDDITMVALNRS